MEPPIWDSNSEARVVATTYRILRVVGSNPTYSNIGQEMSYKVLQDFKKSPRDAKLREPELTQMGIEKAVNGTLQYFKYRVEQ